MLTTIGEHKHNRERYENLRHVSTPPGYNFLDCTYHLERTLDEAYYPGLTRKTLERRNHDQIVSHCGEDFDRYSANEVVTANTNAPILMVPQLWLWKIGNILISAHSMTRASDTFRKAGAPHGQTSGELWDLVLEESCPDVQMGLIIASYVDNFGKVYRAGGTTYLPTLDLIENRLVELLSEVGEYVGISRSGDVEFAKERYFMHVVSDVRSKLAMINYFLEQQERIWKI